MNNANRRNGTRFELKMCELLAERGYWVHQFAQNHAGQPVDLIAAKDGKAYLIDCKVCSHNSFSTDRIEENQRLAMERWNMCGNTEGLFAVTFGTEVYMIELRTLLSAEKKHLREQWFKVNALSLEEWTA